MPEGKTKTIKKRRIDVYLPTLETKNRWQAEAAKRNAKVSEMVFQIVEAALTEGWEDSGHKQAELQKEVEDLTEDMAALRQRVRELETLNERMERDLAQYRAQLYLSESPKKDIDPRVVRLLMESRAVDGRPRTVTIEEIRKSLHIEPQDVDPNRALNEQLEFLEEHEMITKTTKGWAWNE